MRRFFLYSPSLPGLKLVTVDLHIQIKEYILSKISVTENITSLLYSPFLQNCNCYY
jgi:hypothetical protein